MNDVRILPPAHAERAAAEAALDAQGIALPLMYRAAAAGAYRIEAPDLLVVCSADGLPAAVLALVSRAAAGMPGHRTMYVPYLGAAVPEQLESRTLDALVAHVRRDARVLRLTAGIFTPDTAKADRLRAALTLRQFRVAPLQNAYTRTLRLGLGPDIEQVLAGLHSSARRNIRELSKRPVVLEPITDPALSERMEELTRETMLRTGGEFRPRDWRPVIELSQALPHRSRLVGIRRTDTAGPDALIGFSWGCHHGDHAVYADSASVRPTDIRIAVAYPLLWDLIAWAKATGARWFDLGGVTLGGATDGDPLGGISDFKRFFSEDLITVGEEWQMAPHTLRAAAAQAVHRWRTRGEAGGGP